MHEVLYTFNNPIINTDHGAPPVSLLCHTECAGCLCGFLLQLSEETHCATEEEVEGQELKIGHDGHSMTQHLVM